MAKSYNSVLNDILVSEPSDFIWYDKNDERFKTSYEQFNQDFAMYLSKLPNNNVKKYVGEVFNRGLVSFGQNQLTKGTSMYFTRVTVEDNKLLRINLDSKEFEIDAKTGDTKNIDECIYATYYAFLRCVVVANRTDIKKDKKLQELLAQYLYQILISVIPPGSIDTPKQKFAIKTIAYYTFYRHFIRESHAAAIKILKEIFDVKNGKEQFDEVLPSLKEIDKYTSVKDFPKMLIDSGALNIDPNVFLISLLKKYKQQAFYCIQGSFDMFLAFVIVTKYPFELFGDSPSVNTNIQKEVEELMISYMRKVKFG